VHPFGRIGSWKPKQLQGTSTDVEWPVSLPNNYFRDQEMSIVVCNRGGKTDDAKWQMETLIQSSSMQNDVQRDSREELFWHENLLMRLVQNDG